MRDFLAGNNKRQQQPQVPQSSAAVSESNPSGSNSGSFISALQARQNRFTTPNPDAKDNANANGNGEGNGGSSVDNLNKSNNRVGSNDPMTN